MVIQHMQNEIFLDNRRKKTNTELNKSLEKLASGYAVNKAADDAAGLAVSEKLRGMIKGLEQGKKNLQDGISYTRTVDGSSQIIHNMLCRLKTLAVQASNDTYTDTDREAIDLEYQQLLEEMEQITDTADFNGLNLFEKHLSNFEYNEGTAVHDTPITINSDNDTLKFGKLVNGRQEEVVIKLPHGRFTADELADEIDNYLTANDPHLIIGTNKDNQFTIQCEGGKIEYIGGSGASLFYDCIVGSKNGKLLGVTMFENDTAEMTVFTGENDEIKFRLGDDDTLYSIRLAAGDYNRPELIDEINRQIAAMGIPGDMKAVPETNENGLGIIALTCEDVITGLSGNFLKIDGKHSPIYDICLYGAVDNNPAVLEGAKSISANTVIERGRNDYFCLDVTTYGNDGKAVSQKVKISLLDGGEDRKVYASANDIASRINSELNAAGVSVSCEATASLSLRFTTDQYGDKCRIKLDRSDVPSGYMVYDLFDRGTQNRLVPYPSNSSFTPAYLRSQKDISGGVYVPASENEIKFSIAFADGRPSQTISFTVPEGNYGTAGLETLLNNSLSTNYPDLKNSLSFTVGSSVTLSAAGAGSSSIKSVTADKTASGYGRLLGGRTYSDSYTTADGRTEKYESYSGSSSGNGGGGNVTSKDGSTKNLVNYSNVTNPFQTHQSGSYLVYTKRSYTPVNGTSTRREDADNYVGAPKYDTTPAKFTLTDVLTQFTADGKSLRDIDFSFSVQNADGTGREISGKIAKGSTAQQAVAELQKQFGDYAVVKQDGNSVQIVTKQEGASVKFLNYSGKLFETAQVNSTARRADAVIDRANGEGGTYDIPASLTLSAAGTHIPAVIDSTNNKVRFSACGKYYDLTLTEKTYSSLADLASEINAGIAAADGGTAGVSVSANGGTLVFRADHKASGSIIYDTTSTLRLDQKRTVTDPGSSPYFDAVSGKIQEPASINAADVDSHFPLTVTSANNTVTMSYASPGNPAENLTVTIPDGTYTSGNSLVNAINSAIDSDPALNGKIKASYSSSGSSKGLTFTTVNGGDGYRITNLGGTAKLDKVKSTNNISGGTVDITTNTVSTPATIKNSYFGSLFNDGGVEITSANNCFSLNINGTDCTFTIPDGIYKDTAGRDAFMSLLNNALSSAGASAVLSGNTLTLTSDDIGSGVKIRVNSVNTAPYFKKATNVAAPVTRNMSETRCRISGTKAITTVDIGSHNNTMKFDFYENGVTGTINISIAEGTYTAAQLASAIQASIDNTVSGSFTVSATGGKLQITGADASSDRSFSGFEGPLFDKVFQAPSFTSAVKASETAGSSSGHKYSFILGRNDMLPETADEVASRKNVIIYKGINDTVKFDLTYLDEKYDVEFAIPEGTYTKSEIAAAIQKAGREAISDITDINGDKIDGSIFHAGIGLSSLGIPESDSDISSVGKLVLSIMTPDDGTVDKALSYIDGVRGTSAYRIFYDAASSPRPSRIIGKADLSGGIDITDKNDSLTVYVDDFPVTAKLPKGHYDDTESVVEALNKIYEADGVIIRAMDYNGQIMIHSVDNGPYVLEKVSGNGSDDLFYGGDRRDTDEEIGIHYGRRTGSYIWYAKTRVDDHLMRINTTGVTNVLRAQKAIDRLEHASAYLSEWRALSGANENRSEHTYARVANYTEQLHSADSKIRDTDISNEMRNYTKLQILMEAQNAVAASMYQNEKSILNIIK